MTSLTRDDSLRRTLLTPLAVGSLLALAACGGDDGAGEGDDGGSGDAFTLAEVEENDSPDSCWAALDGTVYDLTEWIDEHPGGAGAIEQICGTDATEQFEQQHDGEAGPEDQLTEFEIGELDG